MFRRSRQQASSDDHVQKFVPVRRVFTTELHGETSDLPEEDLLELELATELLLLVCEFLVDETLLH